MNSTKLLRYSMQLSMLKQLRSLKLINENEYRLIEKKLKKDYAENGHYSKLLKIYKNLLKK